MEKFNTKYKVGQVLLCKKDLVWGDKTLFVKGEKYIINKIEYTRWSGSSPKTTIHHPFYFLLKDKGFSSMNEEFTTNEETIGASGMSGYGKIEEYFEEYIEQTK